MAWSDMPATADTDWSKVSWYNQFWAAVNERRAVTEGPAWQYPLATAGTDIQYVGTSIPGAPLHAHSLYTLQNWIETYCTSFVATKDSGLNPLTNYDNVADIEMWTWAKMETRLFGGNSGGWTRKNSGGTSYGKVQAGDYFGPHLFNDLRTALDAMIWLHAGQSDVGWDASGDNNYSAGGQGLGFYGTWGAAQAAASLDETVTENDGPAVAYTNGQHVTGSGYKAWFGRRYCYGTIQNMPTSDSKHVDWYEHTKAGSSDDEIYDDNGDDVIEDKWSLWLTTSHAAAVASYTTTTAIGDTALDRPTWCNSPAADSTSGRGYSQSSAPHLAQAIIRMTGFTYLP